MSLADVEANSQSVSHLSFKNLANYLVYIVIYHAKS